MAKKEQSEIIHISKKCPYCYAYLQLDATKCDYCKNRIGTVDKFGFAEKPTDWPGYFLAFFSMAAFVYFVWWGFFRDVR
jgi:hypothetical protein